MGKRIEDIEGICPLCGREATFEFRNPVVRGYGMNERVGTLRSQVYHLDGASIKVTHKIIGVDVEKYDGSLVTITGEDSQIKKIIRRLRRHIRIKTTKNVGTKPPTKNPKT